VGRKRYRSGDDIGDFEGEEGRGSRVPYRGAAVDGVDRRSSRSIGGGGQEGSTHLVEGERRL
jgi:hypothetical protein